jgi:uncharacterized protein
MSETTLIVVAIFVSLFVSSIAGYGGSLILVPTLGALLGPREGIAFAAVVLAWNNVFKVIAYRHTLALREGWPLVAVAAVGVSIGARTLVALSDRVVIWTVIVVTGVSLIVELVGTERLLRTRRRMALPAMAASSFLSGVSGTSGPLKGVAIRSYALPRLEHVGLAACVSLIADVFKVEVFASAGLLDNMNFATLALVLPMMPVAAWVGRYVNGRMNEEAFRWVFWSIVAGYTIRMTGYWW